MTLFDVGLYIVIATAGVAGAAVLVALLTGRLSDWWDESR